MLNICWIVFKISFLVRVFKFWKVFWKSYVNLVFVNSVSKSSFFIVSTQIFRRKKLPCFKIKLERIKVSHINAILFVSFAVFFFIIKFWELIFFKNIVVIFFAILCSINLSPDWSAMIIKLLNVFNVKTIGPNFVF